MKIDRAGIPYVAAALAPAAALALFRRPGWAVPFAAVGGFFAYFFRDPERTVPDIPGAVLSPADGRVLFAGDAEGEYAPPGQWRQISIFLSPLDVHINRAPVSGRVTRVDYRPGTFMPAYDPRAAVCNERSEIWFDHHGEAVVCRQVAGALARRVVCRLEPGMEVRAGERFGLIKFGSRTDLFLPPHAVLHARPGERVRCGETILATITTAATAQPPDGNQAWNSRTTVSGV
jgi:phosphatidylserine decarboxylase